MAASDPAQLTRPLLRLLIALVVAAILAFTLWPFQFSIHPVGHFSWQTSLSDVTANIALFLPLGFLARLSRPGLSRRWGLPELLIGAALSLAVESAQLYLPMRQSQYADILCNAGGSWLGALLAGFAIRQLALPHGNRLPEAAAVLLLALLLLTPLLWLNAPGIAPQPAPLASLLPLSLAGAVTIGALGGLLREDGHDFAPRASSLIAMAWAVLALLPYLEKHPAGVLAHALLLGIATPLVHWLTLRRLAGQGAVLPASTRPVLALLVTLYLLAHLFTLAGATWRDWHWQVTLLPNLDKSRGVSMVANLGPFVLLGYLLAGQRGQGARWRRPWLQATGLGALLVLVSGWLSRPALSALELALLPACWAVGLLLDKALRGHRPVARMQRSGIRGPVGHLSRITACGLHPGYALGWTEVCFNPAVCSPDAAQRNPGTEPATPPGLRPAASIQATHYALGWTEVCFYPAVCSPNAAQRNPGTRTPPLSPDYGLRPPSRLRTMVDRGLL